MCVCVCVCVYVCYGIVPGDLDNNMVRGLAVEHVSSFVYLASVLTPNARSC